MSEPVVNPPQDWKVPDALAKPQTMAPPSSRYTLSAHEMIRLELCKALYGAVDHERPPTRQILAEIDSIATYVTTGLIPPPSEQSWSRDAADGEPKPLASGYFYWFVPDPLGPTSAEEPSGVIIKGHLESRSYNGKHKIALAGSGTEVNLAGVDDGYLPAKGGADHG